MERVTLLPNRMYYVGAEIPTGFYCYFYSEEHKSDSTSGCAPNEAAIHLYIDAPVHSCWRGTFGCVQITPKHLCVKIENGLAFYLGEDRLGVLHLLQTATFGDGVYPNNEAMLVVQEHLKVKLLRKDTTVHFFTGESDAMLWNQFWFSLNSENYWIGAIDMLTHKRYSSVAFSISQPQAGRTFSCSEAETTPIFNVDGADYFICRIPTGVCAYATDIEWVKPSFAKKSLMRTEKTIQEIHSELFSRTEALLSKLADMGLPIDIQQELDFFATAPDLMAECHDFLNKHLAKVEAFSLKRIPKKETFTFVVRATHDKQYYCAASLADNATKVEYDNKRNLFYVTFAASQIEKIALMYTNLSNMVNTGRNDLMAAQEHLEKYDYFTYLQKEADGYILKLRDKYGYSGKVTSSVLLSIIKATKKARKQKLNLFYDEMKRQHRIQTKWKSEYSLFVLIRKFVVDATYQYRADWLGQQSFDIYLPSQKIAIEYQGKQHYDAISAFGGETDLEYNAFRDNKKQLLAEANGVKIIYWSYIYDVSRVNVLVFLKKHGIQYSEEAANDESTITGVEMAPVVATAKKDPPQRTVSKYIVQYDLKGIFVAKHETIKAASQASGAGVSSINKVLAGERYSAGRFVWKKYEADNIPNQIVIDFDVSKINDGK